MNLNYRTLVVTSNYSLDSLTTCSDTQLKEALLRRFTVIHMKKGDYDKWKKMTFEDWLKYPFK